MTLAGQSSKSTGFPDPDPELKGQTFHALYVFMPFGVLAFHLLLLDLLLSPSQLTIVIGLMIAYILPPAGKETVIPIGIVLGIPWWLMAGTIAMIDIETGLFMAYNFDLAYRLPLLGVWLKGFTVKSREYIRKKSWLGRLYFSGIVLLVMIPVFGSGGIRGSVIGRLLGMERETVFAAIFVGAVAGSLLMAFFSDTVIVWLCSDVSVPDNIAAIACMGK